MGRKIPFYSFFMIVMVLVVLPRGVYVEAQEGERVFKLEEGESLNLRALREIDDNYGTVTICKSFHPETTFIDLMGTRTGSEEFAQEVLRVISTWRYSEWLYSSEIAGIAKVTVSATEKYIKMDLIDLGEVIQGDIIEGTRFPDPDEQKSMYVKYEGFDDDRVFVHLHPQFVKRIEEEKGVLASLIDRTTPIFFTAFVLLALFVLFLVLFHLGFDIWVIVSVALGWLLIVLSGASGGMLIFVSILAFVVLGIGILLQYVFKANVLNENKVEGDKNVINSVIAKWREALELQPIIEEDDVKGWEEKVLPKLNTCICMLCEGKSEKECADQIDSPGCREKFGSEEENGKRPPKVNVILAGIVNQKNNKQYWYASQEIDRGVDRAIENEVGNIRGFLDYLWAIGGLSPMIGLLGTVVGIAGSFNKIAQFRGLAQAEMMQRLAGGINQALYTTIIGLIIGLTAVIFYYVIKLKIDRKRAQWEKELVDITNLA